MSLIDSLPPLPTSALPRTDGMGWGDGELLVRDVYSMALIYIYIYITHERLKCFAAKEKLVTGVEEPITLLLLLN